MNIKNKIKSLGYFMNGGVVGMCFEHFYRVGDSNYPLYIGILVSMLVVIKVLDE